MDYLNDFEEKKPKPWLFKILIVGNGFNIVLLIAVVLFNIDVKWNHNRNSFWFSAIFMTLAMISVVRLIYALISRKKSK